MVYFLKLITASFITALFTASVIILLIIIVDLCRKLSSKHKNKAKQKELQFFLLITIVTVICFELTSLLIICVTIQIILLDTNLLDEDSHWLGHVYYESFEYIEYMIAIFDTLGHLGVIVVFIARFQVIFRANALFNSQKRLITILYSCLFVLFSAAVCIIILIFMEHNVTDIIIIEVVWEILVDFMCLWILYLFMSKLYQLLKLSFKAHLSSNKINPKKEFIQQLVEATKATITHSKSQSSKLKTTNQKFECTMTIDGMKVDPVWRTASKNHIKNHNKRSRDISPDPSVNNHTELTVNTLHIHFDKSDNDKSDNDHSENEITDKKIEIHKQESAVIDLIGVMTKSTLLVTFAVIVSVLGVIGNIFIEIQEMKRIEKHDVSMEELWADVLPAIDVLITSLMLYLQFNFTHKVYRFFLRRLDVWFLKNCLKFMECFWKREFQDEARMSSLITNSTATKTLETETRPI